MHTLYADNEDQLPLIDLLDHKHGEPTGDQYHYLIDESQEMDINDVSSNNVTWYQPEPGVTNRGFSVINSWMRFALHNSGKASFYGVLEYVDPAAASIDVYYRPLGSRHEFKHHNFTYNKPANTRPVAFYRPAFPINLEANSSQEVYIRIFAGDDFPMHSFTAMRIWEENSFHRSSQKELSLMTILLSTEILMGLATLILFFLTRDSVFLYYTFFVFSAASLFASFSGMWGYFFSTSKYELWMVVLQISICQIAALLFVRRFLNTREHLPWVDKIILGVVAIDVLGVILNLFGQPHLSRIIIDFTAIGYFFLVPVGLLSQQKGVPQANLFTASWVVFIIGMALASARLRGYIPDSALAQWTIYIGGFIEVFLLATIMVLYVRLLQKEKAIVETRYRDNLHKTAKQLQLRVDEQTTQLKHAKEQAELEARIDVLTGLTNRRAFIETAQKSIARIKRSKSASLFLLFLDIDYFKKVNDTYGHAAGDFVLTWVGKTISNTLREADIVSRIGGEEFAILLESDDTQSAIETSERLRLTVADTDIRFQKKPIQVTVSIGLAKYADHMDLDTLMQAADSALYKAKTSGRNQTQVLHT